MKSYMKPSFGFVALEATAASSSGCAISSDEKKELIEIFGDRAFTSDGQCLTVVEGYCEFASAEYTNPIKAFGS